MRTSIKFGLYLLATQVLAGCVTLTSETMPLPLFPRQFPNERNLLCQEMKINFFKENAWTLKKEQVPVSLEIARNIQVLAIRQHGINPECKSEKSIISNVTFKRKEKWGPGRLTWLIGSVATFALIPYAEDLSLHVQIIDADSKAVLSEKVLGLENSLWFFNMFKYPRQTFGVGRGSTYIVNDEMQGIGIAFTSALIKALHVSQAPEKSH